MLKLLFMSFTALAADPVFISFIDSEQTVDLSKTPLKAALMTSYDCAPCHSLLTKLNKKCKALNITIFAAGTKKQVKAHLSPILSKNKNTPIFYGKDTVPFSNLGADLTPFYISTKGKKYEGERQVYKAILRDKACKK